MTIRADDYAVVINPDADAEVVAGTSVRCKNLRLLAPCLAGSCINISSALIRIRTDIAEIRADDRRVSVERHAVAEMISGVCVVRHELRLLTPDIRGSRINISRAARVERIYRIQLRTDN